MSVGKCVFTGRLPFRTVIKRCHSSGSEPNRIRNIGILAHIDAGKTTTTERMLFYSGKTRSLGEVHHGNTVTDFLSQERERGITICSAVVSLPWHEHCINLIDTPGHIDFTMEVEQCLGAVDGAVVVLDASAGVEAQTMTVWAQADRYCLPRMVFANKMDRADADFDACLADLKQKLDVRPVPLQHPVMGKKGLEGIIDVVAQKLLTWDAATEGRTYTAAPIPADLAAEVREKRNAIVDMLSGFDDALAEHIIEQNTLDSVDVGRLKLAVRRATVGGHIVPMLLGSAYKNTGVQTLMTAVVDFMPAPFEQSHNYTCFGDDFAARVFKVTHDKQRGPLSLVRVLNGSLRKGAKVTTSRGASEVLQRIYEPLADEYREIPSVHAGDVAVCAGLKHTVTGDLLITSASSLRNAQKRLGKDHGDDMLTLEPRIPDAVYFCSVEPPSLSQQTMLDKALQQLQREDPSLAVRYDEATMQTVLGGMGALHLDIIRSRIKSEYKIDAELGPLQIAYTEMIEADHRDTWTAEKDIAGVKQQIFIDMTLAPVNGATELFRQDSSPEAMQYLSLVRPRHIQSVKKGAVGALERGPILGGKVVEVTILLHNMTVGRGTADSFIMSAAAQCVQKILLNASCRLLEPIMLLEIVCPGDRVASVLADLSRRRATVRDVTPRGTATKVVSVLAPLAELASYSSVLRTLSSGRASVSMQPHGHARMRAHDEQTAIRRAQGLE